MENLIEMGIEGFQESTLSDLVELRKALDIGYTLPVSGNDAIRVESLDATLKILTYQAQHIRFWNEIPKDDAYSTVEEYNQLTAYGDEASAFVPSGVLPNTEDSTYVRANQLVKYLGTTRVVNHPSTLIRTVPADLIARETQNGVLWLMRKIDQGLFEGDATVVPLEWNGVSAQIRQGAGNIIDLRGAPLGENDIQNGAQLIIDNYGFPSVIYSNPKVFTDFSKLFVGLQRWQQPGAPAGYAGTPITGYNTLSGKLDFRPDVFVKRGTIPPAVAVANAPNAPTIALADPGATANSQFGAADAGAYKYQVTAVNQYGESLPCALSGAVSPAAGESVNVTITDGGGTFPATGYKIYRTTKGGSTVAFLGLGGRIPRATTSPGVYTSPTVYADLNAWLPGMFQGLMLDMTPQSLMFKQLSPMFKMDLATIAPSIRWMQLMYGTPIVYATAKNVLYINVGLAA